MLRPLSRTNLWRTFCTLGAPILSPKWRCAWTMFIDFVHWGIAIHPSPLLGFQQAGSWNGEAWPLPLWPNGQGIHATSDGCFFVLLHPILLFAFLSLFIGIVVFAFAKLFSFLLWGRAASPSPFSPLILSHPGWFWRHHSPPPQVTTAYSTVRSLEEAQRSVDHNLEFVLSQQSELSQVWGMTRFCWSSFLNRLAPRYSWGWSWRSAIKGNWSYSGGGGVIFPKMVSFEVTGLPNSRQILSEKGRSKLPKIYGLKWERDQINHWKCASVSEFC